MPKPKVEIWFELETRCNLRCRFCYNFWRGGAAPEPARMSRPEIERALRNLLDEVECERIALSGGEPLLNEYLYDVLAYLRPYAIPVVLTTNGTLLDRGTVRRLMGAGVTSFQIPFHSTSPAMHDWLSGAPCFHQTLRALALLREEDANIVPVFVAAAANLPHFPNVLRVCARLGICQMIFNRFVPSGLGLSHRDELGVPGDGELIDTLLQANRVARELSLWIELGTPIKLLEAFRSELDRVSGSSCPVGPGQLRWTIGSDGSLRRCNHSAASAGNLLNGGAEMLARETGSRLPPAPDRGIVPCQFLVNDPFVQIRVA
jgi:MoaA/NifB/PqqE/SkfB family radical SAM enzyme